MTGRPSVRDLDRLRQRVAFRRRVMEAAGLVPPDGGVEPIVQEPPAVKRAPKK